MVSKTKLIRAWIILGGLAATIFAVVVSSHSYGRFLLGADGKDLFWGPTLFRVLLFLHGCLMIWFGVKRRERTPLQAGSEVTTEKSSTRITPAVLFTMIVLSVLAIVLRLWNLNSDLWIDEVFTLLDFVRRPMGEILTSFPSQNQHMLFSILARFSTSIFGESAWSLRLPSVVFAIGSIWAFFFLCRRLLGVREALLGSALMTVSYHHIWFSQNARGYMGLLVFTLTATWCWLEALAKNERRWWIGYVASVVLGMWIHPTMAFVVASHGITYLLFLVFPRLGGADTYGRSVEYRSGLRPIAAWLISISITTQLYALALPEFLAVGLHEESPQGSEWTNPLWVVTESLKALNTGFGGLAIVLLGAGFVAFGWLSLFRQNPRTAINMVLPAILAGGTMLAIGHNIWPRFFFFSMGFGLLIVIHGAMDLPNAASRFVSLLRRNRLTASTGVAFACVLILASLATVPKNYALPKQDFSGAREYVESRRSTGDMAVAVSLAGIVYGDYLKPHWPVVKTAAELENIEPANGDVWLIYTLPIEVRSAKPELWNLIERDYRVERVFPGTLSGGDVYVCRRNSDKREIQ